MRKIILTILILFIVSSAFAVDSVYEYQRAVKMPEAWALLQNRDVARVKVAVIDAGFNDTYADFDNLIEYRNFWNATDPVNGDPITGNVGTMHGSWVSSILAAEHDGQGYKGAAPNVDLIVYKGFGDVGTHGDYFPLFYAIKRAVHQGAKVVSISTGERWGVPLSSTEQEYRDRYQAAFDYMKANGVYFSTGAGNSYDNLDDSSTFWVPAELDTHAPLLCGLSTEYNGSNTPSKWWYNTLLHLDYPSEGEQTQSYEDYVHALSGTSQYFDEIWHEPMDEPEYTTGKAYRGANYGSICDLAVPCEDLEGLGYGTASGISGATPLVAGLAAIIKGINPELKADQIENIIVASANTDSVTTKKFVGGKRVNFEKAVLAAIATIVKKELKPRTYSGEELQLTNFHGDSLALREY